MSETQTITSAAGIMRTNRMFITLNAIGECDAKGRAVFSRGYKNKKIIAEPGRPIATLILPLMAFLLESAIYQNGDDPHADLEKLKRYVASLQCNAAPADAGDGEKGEVKA